MKLNENEICDFCGKSVAETKSNRLVEKMRHMIPPSSSCTRSSDKKDAFFGCSVGVDWIQKCLYIFKMVGEDEAAKILLAYHKGGLFITDHECEDCANLDDAEYNGRIYEWCG